MAMRWDWNHLLKLLKVLIGCSIDFDIRQILQNLQEGIRQHLLASNIRFDESRSMCRLQTGYFFRSFYLKSGRSPWVRKWWSLPFGILNAWEMVVICAYQMILVIIR